MLDVSLHPEPAIWPITPEYPSPLAGAKSKKSGQLILHSSPHFPHGSLQTLSRNCISQQLRQVIAYTRFEERQIYFSDLLSAMDETQGIPKRLLPPVIVPGVHLFFEPLS
jgi:hypothetical protein